MSNAAIAMDGQAAVTHTALSWKFIHWGFGLFITGFLVGFLPITALHGGWSVGGDVGPEFLKRMTLWWGCPAVLAELTLKTGGLGMIAIGLCYGATVGKARRKIFPVTSALHPRSARTASSPMLVCAGAGYVICNISGRTSTFKPLARE